MCVCMYAYLIHAWVYTYEYVCLSFCILFVCMNIMCMNMCTCVFPSQAGHDSRPTAAEQPSQDLFLTLLACLLQPGQKELHTGVRMQPPPTSPPLTYLMGSVQIQSIQETICPQKYENWKSGLLRSDFLFESIEANVKWAQTFFTHPCHALLFTHTLLSWVWNHHPLM